ncbi:MAG: Ku protein [Desulfovibrionales bacterium]
MRGSVLMAARAIWKGVIRFEEVEVPVKLYSAVQDRKVHFRLLHEKDLTPVKQKMVHPQTGEPVPFEEIVRGVEVEGGVIVLLEDEELEAVQPQPSRNIAVTRFVEPSLLNHQWYDRPYFLSPDGNEQAYFALARALGEGRKEGIARWTMRGKEYIGAMQSDGRVITLVTLFHAEEVIDAAALPRPQGRELMDQELAMAEQLVRALEGDFDPSTYRDEYRDRVQDLVETKARGGIVEFKRVEEKKPEGVSLTNMLQQSIRRVEKEREVA